MTLDTTHLERSLLTLDASLKALNGCDPHTIEYEIYRNAVIKGFELVLEVCGKLLRKALNGYTGNPRQVAELPYKAVFRESATHGLLDIAMVERWFTYRDNRNSTAHDYGLAFAEETLRLLPQFIVDAQAIASKLKNTLGKTDDT